MTTTVLTSVKVNEYRRFVILVIILVKIVKSPKKNAADGL